MEGKKFSHYRIIKKLGEGAMGEVYLALNEKLGRKEALKFLKKHLIEDEEQRNRFEREARAASPLDHPNICGIHDFGTDDEGRIFISMAYYEGTTLSIIGKIEQNKIIDIAIQVAQGLVYAHNRNRIHRDIKPGNLMVTTDGTVKILDFGLAKILKTQDPLGTQGGALTGTTAHSSSKRLSESGSILGTVSYMSPEQIMASPLTPQTDIWSLGVTMYELLSGRLPFQGSGYYEVWNSIVNEEPRPLSDLVPGIDPRLERIVSKAMMKQPSERYQTMKEMLTDLELIPKELEAPDKAALIPAAENKALETSSAGELDTDPSIVTPQVIRSTQKSSKILKVTALLGVVGLIILTITLRTKSNPLVHYRFDDDFLTTGSVLDSSGNGYDARVEGDVYRVKGVRGKCIQFNGRGYIELERNLTAGFKKITVAVWVKSQFSAENMKIVCTIKHKIVTDGANEMSGWILDHNGALEITDDAGQPLYKGANCSLPHTLISDEWYHLAWTYDGNRIRKFFNGRIYADCPTTGAPLGAYEFIQLGAWEQYRAYDFIGELDEFIIYNRVLTDTEIAGLYQQTKPEAGV